MGSLNLFLNCVKMPPKKEQKSKEAKIAAALAGSKKGKKKKWSKGKMAEKKENKPIFIKVDGENSTYEDIKKQLPKMNVITIATLSEKFQINGSLARKILQEFEERKVIQKVCVGRCFKLFTKA